MLRCHRRGFLPRAAAGGIATTFVISGTKASGRVLGANDRVRIAVAGVNGRGRAHLQGFGEMPDVEIAFLVDPDSRLFASRAATVKKLAGNTPQCVQDFRRALDDQQLDAVSIVTPNHWHALLAHLGEEVSFDRQAKALADEKTFHESFEDMKRHLAAALDLRGASYRLGRVLHFDAKSERFVGDPEADALLTRSYRGPFVVPQQV